MTTVVLDSELGLPVVEALGGGVSVDDVGVNVDFDSDVVLDSDDDEDEEEIGTSGRNALLGISTSDIGKRYIPAAHISVKTSLVVLKSGRLQRDWAQVTVPVTNAGLEQRQAVSVL